MTRKETFEAIKAETTNPVIAEFCDKEIAAIERKATKARERAASKRANGDPLADAIYAVLTDEPMLISDIAAKVDSTNAKVSARLANFVKDGSVVKSTVKVEKRKLTAYALA